MISNQSNSLSLLFSGFKNESEDEEEGLIDYEHEMDPQKFRVDMPLSQAQLLKFFEYYIPKDAATATDVFKYTKIDLNKINNIAHNHYHHISKDIKLFKLYKCLIQIVTQDMNDWIQKDYHCGDVILEILKEVQYRKENPKYLKIINKLRIDEIVIRQIAKAEVIRNKAEEDRKNNKRMKNWAKKHQKNKIDPYDSIPMPIKRPMSNQDNEPSEIFKRPFFMESEEKELRNIKEKNFVDDRDEGFINKAREHQRLLSGFEVDSKNEEKIIENNKKNQENPENIKNIENSKNIETSKNIENSKSIENSKNIENIENIEIDEWFPCSFNALISEIDEEIKQNKEIIIPKSRHSIIHLDPRIGITLKCMGLDFILLSSSFSQQLEKLIIIINIKCLASMISLKLAKSLKIQIPKDATQISIKSESYLISYRPEVKEFLSNIERFSQIYIYSEYSQDMNLSLFPDKNFISTKKVSFSEEMLLILDNNQKEWNSALIIPALYYSPFINTKEILLDSSINSVNDLEIVEFSKEIGPSQLKSIENALEHTYSSILERSCQYFAIWEFKEYIKSILEGIIIDIKYYQERIGQKGYTNEKLEIYCHAIKILGGAIKENNNCKLVEEKKNDKEISGKWIICSLLRYSVIPKF